MHFVGMLAWVPPFPLFYSVDKTVISVIAAVLASTIAMRIAAASEVPSRQRLVIGSLSVASGICTMHYIGMSAMRFTLPERWDLSWIALSCIVALAASLAALLLLNISGDKRFTLWHQTLGALVIGLAICGMHYSGMRAMMLSPGAMSLRLHGDASGSILARIGVGNTLVFIFCLLVISHHDRLGFLRRAHESQLQAQQASKLAEQMSAAGRIAAAIAHEVNNPLEAITNLLYLIEKCQIDDDGLSYLHLAQSELRRVSEITTHTLKFYRQQSSATPTSIPELIESVLVLFKNKIERQNVHVCKQWRDDLPKVECRAGEIRQVIANLVGNAIDAMHSGGSLRVTIRSVDEIVEIEVEDSGQGIPAAARDKLFQPFFTTKGASGTGLGLSISAEIVEKHGGKLRFDSRTEPPKQGTTFTFHLPLKLVSIQAEPRKVSQSDQVSSVQR